MVFFFLFKYPGLFYNDERCIKNVLDFIEIEQSDSTKLIENFSVERNLNIITAYFFFNQTEVNL